MRHLVNKIVIVHIYMLYFLSKAKLSQEALFA